MSYQNAGGNTTEPGNMTEYGFISASRIPPDTIPAIVLMFFILLINSGVILLVSGYSYLRTTSNIILASLAVSDFLVGFVGIPLLVACSSTFLFPVCLSSNIFFTFMSLSTVLHITVMTCDRYIYIMWAIRYHEIVHRGRVIAVLCVTWFISLTSVIRLSWTLDVSIATAKEDLALVQEKETTYFLFNLIVFFFIPLVAMISLDAHMLLLLRKQYQRIARENLPAEFVKRENKMQRRQRRAVLTCVLLLILYAIFWLPYFILELMLQNQPTIPEYLVTTIYYLRLCPSLFNPLAYTLRKPDLKKRAKWILHKMSSFWRKDISRKGSEQMPLSSLAHV